MERGGGKGPGRSANRQGPGRFGDQKTSEQLTGPMPQVLWAGMPTAGHLSLCHTFTAALTLPDSGKQAWRDSVHEVSNVSPTRVTR